MGSTTHTKNEYLRPCPGVKNRGQTTVYGGPGHTTDHLMTKPFMVHPNALFFYQFSQHIGQDTAIFKVSDINVGVQPGQHLKGGGPAILHGGHR